MLTSGDVADVDFGLPRGREAGFQRPAIVVTAQRLLDRSPNVVQVVHGSAMHNRESGVRLFFSPVRKIRRVESVSYQRDCRSAAHHRDIGQLPRNGSHHVGSAHQK